MAAHSFGAFHRELELLTPHWDPQEKWFACHVSGDPVLLLRDSSWPCIVFIPNSCILSNGCSVCLTHSRAAGKTSWPSHCVWRTWGRGIHMEGCTRLGGGSLGQVFRNQPLEHPDTLLCSLCSFACQRGQKQASSGSSSSILCWVLISWLVLCEIAEKCIHHR